MTYYNFDSRTFRDRKVREVLKRHEHKWLWATLLASDERTRLPGLMRLRITSLADEAQLTVDDTLEGLALMESSEMIVIDREVDLIQLPNAPKHNSCPNANVLRGWYALWEELPHCALKHEHIRLLVHTVNLRTASLGQAWDGTFGAVLAAWDARDPDIRYLARQLRSRWSRGEATGGSGPAAEGNGLRGNGYQGNGLRGNRSQLTVDEVTVAPLGSGIRSGSGSGSGRDGFRGNRNAQTLDLSSEEIAERTESEEHGRDGADSEQVGTSVAGHEEGRPGRADAAGQGVRLRSRVAEIHRSRGTSR